MYKKFNINNFLAFIMIVAGSLSFTSCDDDDVPTPPTEATTDAMFGDYKGRMITLAVNPLENAPAGVEIVAKADKDTIYFESLPIRDLVVSIVGEANADAIVEKVGKVSYKIGYEPKLNEAKDSISFKLEPKTLHLTIPVLPQPTEGEGEVATMNVEVKISAEQSGNYELKTTDMKFKFNAEEVAIVKGEEKTPIEAFKATTFNFNLKKTDNK